MLNYHYCYLPVFSRTRFSIRKILSVVLATILLFSLFQPSTAYASSNYVEVTKNSAPIRGDYYETGTVLAWVSKGTILEYTGTKTNLYLNKWYKVKYNGRTGWIYSENVTEHSHKYQRVYYEGNTYAICGKCMTIAVEQATTISYSTASTIAATLPAALGASALDGPLPMGDAAALVMIATAYCLEVGNISPAVIYEMVDEISLTDFADANNYCSSESFYKVVRTKGPLYYVDYKCMDAIRAYVCVRYLHIDVWTASPAAALVCASLNGTRHFMERDANKPSYFYHYHLGTSHQDMDSSNHIFFGYNDYGEGPR